MSFWIGLSKQFEDLFIVHPLFQSSFVQLIPLCLCPQVQVKRSYSAVRVETLKKKKSKKIQAVIYESDFGALTAIKETRSFITIPLLNFLHLN